MSHLFVIILDCEEHTRNTIIVYVRTVRSPKVDRTTILNLGDHDFIKHESHIEYRQAQIVSVDDLDQMILEGKAQPMAPMKADAFKRICDGIMKSPFTPYEVREMYNDYLYRKMKS
ncbi:MAG: hypothetical protein Q7U68_01430 [Candidatus Roizmanbacteria bacterium]|nr:hypothetical protein [Candidatus Roizmanbacteria bacterium]